MGLEQTEWFRTGPDEELVWHSHPSFIADGFHFFAGAVIALGGFLGWVYILLFEVPILTSSTTSQLPIEWAFFVAGLIGVGYLGYHYLILTNTYYVITTEKVMLKTGIIGRETSKKSHDEIVRVDVDVSTTEAFLSWVTSEDIGDIVLRSADDRAGTFFLRNVPEVSTAEKYLEQLSDSTNVSAKYGEESLESPEPEPSSDEVIEATGTTDTTSPSVDLQGTVEPSSDDSDDNDPFTPSDKA